MKEHSLATATRQASLSRMNYLGKRAEVMAELEALLAAGEACVPRT